MEENFKCLNEDGRENRSKSSKVDVSRNMLQLFANKLYFRSWDRMIVFTQLVSVIHLTGSNVQSQQNSYFFPIFWAMILQIGVVVYMLSPNHKKIIHI